jgi:hypothetical protein
MTTTSEQSQLTKNQKRIYGPKQYPKWAPKAQIKAEVRFDDECGNGHNTFSITADIYIPGRRDIEAGGCLHTEVAEVFPELAPFLKWHLCSTGGPMHYPGNVLYFASERDCWGKLKGEPKTFETFVQFGDNPIKHYFPRERSFVKFLQDAHPNYDFEVLPIEHRNDAGEDYKFGPKYTFGGYGSKWHECPFGSESQALDFLKALQTCNPKYVSLPVAWGEGKARELDKAREAAIWPEATDEELCAPDLADKLKARLPGLLADFRRDVESLGFTW